MIITLPKTNTSESNKALVNARKEGGVLSLSRVMTLVIDATGADADEGRGLAMAMREAHP